MNMMDTNTYDEKEEIKKYIKDGVEMESNLDKIKASIRKKTNRNSLNSIEENYINHKYIKYCLKECYNELSSILNRTEQNDIHNLIGNIIKIKTVEDISSLFPNSKYVQLITKNVHLLLKSDCDYILIQFKQHISYCLKQQIKQQNELLIEVEKELKNFFSIYEIHKCVHRKELLVDNIKHEFLCILIDNGTNANMNDLLKNLFNLEQISKEKLEAIIKNFENIQRLYAHFEELNQTNLTNVYGEQITNMIYYSLTPVTFSKDTSERQKILITGVYIVLSLMLSELEKLIEPSSTDIYLTALEILFIDCDLKNKKWHGKNLAINAKRIIIIENRTINVSGLHGEPQTKPPKADNGQQGQHEKNQNGKHGHNGTNGESGGNITIIAEIIEYEENLTILSNGGNAGYGQDGGNGADGENGSDGVGLSLDEFKENFPATAISVGAKEAVIDMCNRVQRISTETLKDITWNNEATIDCRYIEGITKDGNKIYFSFYENRFGWRQSYCLFLGTCGKPGYPGGFQGLGGYAGEPGYAGHIKILLRSSDKSKIKILAIDGCRGSGGKPGKDGKFGKPGENKPDVGYIDFILWREPIFYGPSWLELSSYKERASNRIRDAEYQNEKIYVAIESRPKPEPPACLAIAEKARQHYQMSKSRKQEATRKHDISTQLLNEFYNDYQWLWSINSIQSLEINTNLLLEQLSYSQTVETNIQKENIRIIKPFINEKHLKLKKIPNKIQLNQLFSSDIIEKFHILYNKKDKETLSYIPDMINELKCEVYNWTQILWIHYLVEDLQSTCEKNQSLLEVSHYNEYENLKSLIIHKLKLSILEEIAQSIEGDSMNINELIKEDTFQGSNSAIHAILGTKNEFNIYEYPEYETVRKDLKENISTIVNDGTEINEDKEKFPQMRKFIEKFYETFPNNDFNSTDINLISDDSAYCFNESILIEYGKYISQNGQPFNQYDIILLAYFYDICLNVYVLSDNDQSLYDLLYIYNKSSHKVQHVLYLGDEFIKLSVRTIENKNVKYLRYNKILYDIQELKEPNKLVEYLENKYFEDRKNQNAIKDDIDQTTINEISDYFEIDIRQTVRLALTPISPEFLSNFNVLKSLKNRFSSEKPFITYEIITLLSMSILNSHANEEDLSVYHWIINAYPQTEWINELALIKFERFTTEAYQKIPLWRLALRQIENKRIIALLILKIEEINEKFDIEKLLLQIKNCYLKQDEYIDILTHVPLSQWSNKLQQYNFIQSIHNAIYRSDFDNKHFPSIIYYLHSLKTKSELLVNRLLEIFQQNRFEIEQILIISQNFYFNIWEFDEEMILKIENTGTDKLKDIIIDQNFLNNNERKSDKLIEIINRDKYTTNKVKINELKIFLENLNKYKIADVIQKGLEINIIQQWSIEFKSRSYEDRIKNLHEALCMVEKAITIYFPEISSLRDAQKLTIASFISNSNNLLAQVATGEGKSLIVASIMIIKCLLGEKGDIITSSPVLAERDANENKQLYNIFDISISHNSSEDLGERKNSYRNDVVYGDLSSFQRDYLLDRFYNKNILGDRYENGRRNIIVDEVDSMLLDKGNTVLYLSHQPASLDTLESIFVFIWQMIITDIVKGNYPFVSDIRKTVLHNLYPILDKQELMKVTDYQELIDEIWNELIQNDNIDEDGKILSCKIEFQAKNLQPFNKHLEYLLNDIFHYERQIEIPNYLKSFVERHLCAWIESAFKALDMEEGRNYIIDVDKSATKLDKHPNIIIIDCDTGVDQLNSQWNEGLHQFLQLKHQCKTSLLSLKAVFISNISFFNMYEHIYGLSGTLGSEHERDFLKVVYNVDFLTVPVALSSKFKEYQPILCKDLLEWRNEIVKQSIEICKKRSVLIICQTIKDVEQIYQSFSSEGNLNLNNIFVYKRSYEKFSVDEHQDLDIGNIIIATNLAGRGTDIKISQELNKNGGLHVILSYLPENYRIEQQAFGRTARKGQNGSGQLIFIDEFNQEDKNDSLLQIIDLKNERDYNEMCRVGKIYSYYETSIRLEEKLFERYHKAYNILKEKIEKEWEITNDKKIIILNSLLNKWTFWLDEIGTMMNNKLEIFQSLEIFLNNLTAIKNSDDLINQLVTEPSELIKLSKCFMKEKNHEKASELLQKVIQDEPKFSHAAYYYKAHCILKQTKLSKDINKTEFNHSLDYAEYLFKHHIDILTGRSAIINNINITNAKILNQSFITIDSYRIQNENICNLYSCFIQSIHDMRGHPVTPEILLNIDIDQELAFSIYNKLLYSSENIFIKKKFNKDFNEKDLKTICIDYQLNYNNMKKYLTETDFIDEKKFKEHIEDLQIPNRQEFWQLMIDKEIITDEQHLIIINVEEIDNKNKKLKEFINEFGKELKSIDEIKPKNKLTIFFQKIEFHAKNIKYIYKSIDKNYQILEQQKLISSNKIATININKLRSTSIGKFQSITPGHFTEIQGLDLDDSNKIYNKLIKQKVIDETTGKLLTNDFKKLSLKEYQIYDQHIITIINCRCLYESQILDILYQLDSQEFDSINLTLPYNLHKDILYDLEASLIIKPVYYNYSKVNVSLCDKLLMKEYSKKLEQLIQKICNNEKEITRNVAKSLQNTIGKLNYLSIPDSHLNVIEENFNRNEKFQHIQELDLFILNGLNHIIDITEKKWTWQMWLSTATILIFGFAQIIGGVYLGFYTIGIGTQIASGLISEGLNDIFYSIFAAKSGYFNWNDYFVHKMRSVIFTIATMGVSALISRGIRYFRFGSKIVGNTGYLSETVGTQLLETSGNINMKNVINNDLHKKVWCRIGKKLTEGIAFGATNAGISYISDQLLKGSCGKIIDELFLKIKESIENKKEQIRQSLKQIYLTHGAQITLKWLTDMSQSNDSDVWYGQVSEWIKKIIYIISDGIKNALPRMNYTNHSSNSTTVSSLLISVFNTSMKSATYINAVAQIYFATNNFIDDKIKKLEEKANECQEGKENIDENELNDIINKTTEQWSKELEDKVDTDIRKKIIEPILSKASNVLLRKLGKNVQKYHQHQKEKVLWKNFQSNRKEYEKQKDLIKNQDQNINTKDVLDKITNKYNHDLLVLMAKTKNPKLIASIIEEGGPMDVICIRAMANLYRKPIRIKNADGKIYPDVILPEGITTEDINNENCISIDFIPGDGENTFGHFVSSEKASEKQIDDNDNNCLIRAVMTAAPTDIDVKYIRQSIAHEIQNSSSINDIIKNGCHRYYISQCDFGDNVNTKQEQILSSLEKNSKKTNIKLSQSHNLADQPTYVMQQLAYTVIPKLATDIKNGVLESKLKETTQSTYKRANNYEVKTPGLHAMMKELIGIFTVDVIVGHDHNPGQSQYIFEWKGANKPITFLGIGGTDDSKSVQEWGTISSQDQKDFIKVTNIRKQVYGIRKITSAGNKNNNLRSIQHAKK